MENDSDKVSIIRFNKNDYAEKFLTFWVEEILVENGIYIEPGTDIFEIEASCCNFFIKNDRENFKVKNLIGGYFKTTFDISDYFKDVKHDDILYYVFKEKDDYLSYNFSFSPKIYVDEFSGIKSIRWSTVGINLSHFQDNIPIRLSNSFKDVGTFNIMSKINLRFAFENIAGIDFITFYFRKNKDDNLYKEDSVIFLFDDNTKCEFEFSESPQNNSYTNDDIFEIKSRITLNELITFSSSRLVKWRKVSIKNHCEYSDIVQNQWYNGDDFSYVLKTYANKYLELVKSEIPNYNPLVEKEIFESSTNILNDICYVYLMLDTTNGYYKIGISNSPKYREKTLQSEKPTINLITTKKYPKRNIADIVEKSLHKAYSNKRIRGEWFLLNDDDVEEILTILN